ncbi:N-methyl-L-tryptophan oxidase [Pseudarthrobacter phenanthrenivorans]|uniref:N-methyl-L-tryptophan oxidase n=1 Tax=Pseudarthrobacter phenanthrenivorans TaxID=361575 RepID=UPI00112E38B5|nr:N-methyl-L-tryptophan oxidase [Pseudarthrobacter phenanthrenivorans]TPV51103.1 N-methyl-L-tryptophan oxidase [Pseudarthrobacter phenanthrenivorans]
MTIFCSEYYCDLEHVTSESGSKMRLDGKQYDVAVIGVGTMGSMALWQLSKAGLRTIGIEQFKIGHEKGGAGGESRIFRVAYKEGPEYVPLLIRSRELWNELTTRSATPIFLPCGALTIGRPDHPEVGQVQRTIELFQLDHQDLSASDMERTYPQHHLLEGEVGILDPAGGLLAPKDAVLAAVGEAQGHGAEVLDGTKVLDIKPGAAGVDVVMPDQTVRAERVVVAAGVWSRALLPELSGKFEVRRSVLHWFGTKDPSAFVPERFPVGIRRSGPNADFSFFPTPSGSEIKCNLHVTKTAVPDPERFDGTIDAEYSNFVRDHMARLIRGLNPNQMRARGYMDGYSPDNHGFFGDLPGNKNITVLYGFSGHGFKISPAIGEAVAEHVKFQHTTLDLSHMALARHLEGQTANLQERNNK